MGNCHVLVVPEILFRARGRGWHGGAEADTCLAEGAATPRQPLFCHLMRMLMRKRRRINGI